MSENAPTTPPPALRKIRSFQDILSIENRDCPVVTLFSGGLDSSYLLSVLSEAGFTQVVALCVDLGEATTLAELEQTTRQFGAELVVQERKRQFADFYVAPALKAQARYLELFPVSSSLARPLIAKSAVELARTRGAVAVLHTANQSQNSLRRLNTAIHAECFDGLFGSPYEYSALSRLEKSNALARYGLKHYAGRKLSGDANIWCREFEAGPLNDPENFSLPEDAFTWSRKKSGLDSCVVELTFSRGDLSRIDGQDVCLVDAIAHLNEIVGGFGHGRYVGLEHLDEGEKVLEVREAPAASILMHGLRHLETAALSANAIVLKQVLERTWTIEAVEGRWNSDVKNAAQAGIFALSERVSGTIRFRVDYQAYLPESICAEKPLYITDRDAWEINKARERGSRSLRDLNSNSFNDNTVMASERNIQSALV